MCAAAGGGKSGVSIRESRSNMVMTSIYHIFLELTPIRDLVKKRLGRVYLAYWDQCWSRWLTYSP